MDNPHRIGRSNALAFDLGDLTKEHYYTGQTSSRKNIIELHESEDLMANRYGEAALMAARQESSAGSNPVARWDNAMERLYPTSSTSRKKGCPRGAFLGLCEEGLIKGIPPGHYTASKDNKAYSVKAAALLIDADRKWSVGELWRAVSNDPEKAHNRN